MLSRSYNPTLSAKRALSVRYPTYPLKAGYATHSTKKHCKAGLILTRS